MQSTTQMTSDLRARAIKITQAWHTSAEQSHLPVGLCEIINSYYLKSYFLGSGEIRKVKTHFTNLIKAGGFRKRLGPTSFTIIYYFLGSDRFADALGDKIMTSDKGLETEMARNSAKRAKA